MQKSKNLPIRVFEKRNFTRTLFYRSVEFIFRIVFIVENSLQMLLKIPRDADLKTSRGIFYNIARKFQKPRDGKSARWR